MQNCKQTFIYLQYDSKNDEKHAALLQLKVDGLSTITNTVFKFDRCFQPHQTRKEIEKVMLVMQEDSRKSCVVANLIVMKKSTFNHQFPR